MLLIEQVFFQEPHCCFVGNDDPVLRLHLSDGGGGYYIVLNATEWSLGSSKEIAEFMRVLQEAWMRCEEATTGGQHCCTTDKETQQ